MEDTLETPLCKLANKYGTDKCPRIKHGYTPIYYKLLKSKRKIIKKVLEMGVGYFEGIQTSDFFYHEPSGVLYHKGASLKMWRDFFSDATIFGADIQPETVFEDRRIKTYVCNQTKQKDIIRMLKQTGSDIDLFIDDGSHTKEDQIYLAKTILPHLKEDVIYFIEDVTYPNYILENLKSHNCIIFNGGQKWRDDNLVLVKNK